MPDAPLKRKIRTACFWNPDKRVSVGSRDRDPQSVSAFQARRNRKKADFQLHQLARQNRQCVFPQKGVMRPKNLVWKVAACLAAMHCSQFPFGKIKDLPVWQYIF